MTEGVVAKWLKQVGDQVEEGDILAEIETDKATMEFESFHEGTLLHIGIQEGETANVDSLLAVIGEKGEDFQALLESDNGSEQVPTKAEPKSEPVEEASAEPTEDASSGGPELPEGMDLTTMPRLSDRTRRGLLEAIGVPGVFGGLTVLLLLVGQMVGAGP